MPKRILLAPLHGQGDEHGVSGENCGLGEWVIGHWDWVIIGSFIENGTLMIDNTLAICGGLFRKQNATPASLLAGEAVRQASSSRRPYRLFSGRLRQPEKKGGERGAPVSLSNFPSCQASWQGR
jgi:hypothetical protein